MAWATPRTWVTAEVVTAVQFNQDIRDNMTMVGSPPRIKVTRTGNQTITNNTITLVTWDLEQYKNGITHSNVTNSQRLTIVDPGLYEVKFQAEFGGHATGFRGIRIALSGTNIAKFYLPATVVAVGPVLNCSVEQRATAGQWFEAEVWHTAGTSLVAISPEDFFSARWVSV